MAGAVAHNLGQILTAAALLETLRLAWYFPALCVAGVLSGIGIGLAAALILRRFPG